MDNIKKQYCRLCVDAISNENFEEISDIAEEIFDILLLKLDLDKNKHVMCKVCALKIMEALKFKSMCLDTDSTIIPYVDVETGSSIDLLEIYAKKKGNKQLIDTLSGSKICKLCMKVIKGKFISIHDVDVDEIEKFIPDMIISVVKDPVFCEECCNSVGTHSKFLNNCLKAEEKIKHFRGGNNFDSPFWISASALCVKAENDMKQVEMEFKEECVESKISVGTSKAECEIKFEYVDIKSEDIWSETKHQDSPNVQTFKCIYCSFMAKYRSPLKRHILTHETNLLDPEEVTNIQAMLRLDQPVHFRKFTCKICDFTTLNKERLDYHQLKHGEKLYKCNICNYKAWSRGTLRNHCIGIHSYVPPLLWLKCDLCHYKTKRKDHLKIHQLKHKPLLRN